MRKKEHIRNIQQAYDYLFDVFFRWDKWSEHHRLLYQSIGFALIVLKDNIDKNKQK